MPEKAWRQFELDMQEALGMRDTIASGSKFYDIGDGVTLDSHPIQAIMDTKYTTKKSYSVNSEFMEQWLQKAAELGKMFLLPIRFEDGKDYVVLEKEEFLTLWLLSKKALDDGV